MAAGIGAATASALRRPDLILEDAVPETFHGLEWAQVWLWIGIAFVTLVGALTQQRRRGVLLSLWLGSLATLAAIRELDLHVVLNPENIHLLGLSADQAVRFRMDWWLSGETSIALRAAWAGVFAVAGSLVVLPFAFARYPWPRRLLRGDRFAWCIVGSIGLLGAAFAGDDLLRGLGLTGLAEELTELLAQIPFLCGAALLALRRARLFSVAPTKQPLVAS
ncbi:MAG: hypothetical protein AAGI53_05820 [Planctomycetota bacterium]